LDGRIDEILITENVPSLPLEKRARLGNLPSAQDGRFGLEKCWRSATGLRGRKVEQVYARRQRRIRSNKLWSCYAGGFRKYRRCQVVMQLANQAF